MNRREFLAAAAAATGYSVFVDADAAPIAAATPVPPREIRDVFETISPSRETPAGASEPHMSLVDLECAAAAMEDSPSARLAVEEHWLV